MRKIVIPLNLIIILCNLSVYGLLLYGLLRKEFSWFLVALQVGLALFPVGLFIWDGKQEQKEMKREAGNFRKKIAEERQKGLEDDVQELRKQVAELQWKLRYTNQSKILS